jgi:hypothetical protein
MFLIFHGPMKNGHGAAAIEYTAINLDHFRGRHWRDEQLRRQDQSRAEQRRGDKRVGGDHCTASVSSRRAYASSSKAWRRRRL